MFSVIDLVQCCCVRYSLLSTLDNGSDRSAQRKRTEKKCYLFSVYVQEEHVHCLDSSLLFCDLKCFVVNFTNSFVAMDVIACDVNFMSNLWMHASIFYNFIDNYVMWLLLTCVNRKIPRDLTEASLSGAGLSIVAALAMMFLFGMVSRWKPETCILFGTCWT